MKKISFLFILGFVLFANCNSKEGCESTEVDEYWANFTIRIGVVNDLGLVVPNVRVRATVQKYFCDGDFDIRVLEEGVTDETGTFTTKTWSKPYTNREDYVILNAYAGENLEQSNEYAVSYDDAWAKQDQDILFTFFIKTKK